jgi:hypothetical protein
MVANFESRPVSPASDASIGALRLLGAKEAIRLHQAGPAEGHDYSSFSVERSG